jgi:DNA gyrase subunit A
MVQRTGVGGISRYGRLSQGVRVMNMKEEDTVSAVALIVESAPGDDGAEGDGDAAGLEAGLEPGIDAGPNGQPEPEAVSDSDPDIDTYLDADPAGEDPEDPDAE